MSLTDADLERFAEDVEKRRDVLPDRRKVIAYARSLSAEVERLRAANQYHLGLLTERDEACAAVARLSVEVERLRKVLDDALALPAWDQRFGDDDAVDNFKDRIRALMEGRDERAAAYCLPQDNDA